MLTSTNRSPSEIGALLDIGSSKITCLIIERMPPERAGPNQTGLRVLGYGQRRADGVRAGMVTDLDRAEAGVRGAIGDAEARAGLTVDDITVALTSSRLSSTHFSAHLDLPSGAVRGEDLRRLAERAREYAARDGRALVYLNRVHYGLDGETGISEPLRMVGNRLTCQFHAVTADPTQLQNLECLIERCYLNVDSFIPTGLAAAMAATTPDEQNTGVLCLDIGAGATKVAVIADGRFLHTDTIAVGGAILTHDIFVSLGAPLAEAERIKTLYGSLAFVESGLHGAHPHWRAHPHDLVGFRAQQGEQQETTRTELARILYPRARRQLEIIKERLARSSITRELAQSIVLTGGGCRLAGFAGLAAEVLGRPVRMGAPAQLAGIDACFQGPGLSAVVGLGLVDASPAEMLYSGGVKNRAYESYLSRMEQWLRESF